MGAIAFLVLFLLGMLIATAGSVVGIVDAFRVSPVWGLLALFVPFALLVYCIKFWGRKWARNSLIMGLGGLGAMLLSLPFGGAFIAQRAAQMGDALEEEAGSVEIPIESVPIPGDEAPPEEVFAEPLVPVAPQLSPIARADLIQSTDPDERRQQIQSSRPDPFAIVPIPPPPVVIAPPPPLPGGGGGTAGGGGAPGGSPGGGSTPPAAPAPGGGAGSAGGGGTTAGAGGATTPPPLAPLPTLPRPTLAEAVVVTGVVTIGNENFAVVTTSAGSQYVRAGQRVADGRVLVKRIDMRGSEPFVVLEENGIEISRPVGGPPPSAEAEAPA